MPNAIAEPGVAAALAHAEAQMLAVADRREVRELAAVDEQQHARVAEPERREPPELGAQVEVRASRPGTIASTRVTGRRSSSVSTASACAANAAANVSTRSASIVRPAAARWPPKRSRWPAQAPSAAVQVERRDRPARALPLAVGAGDHHDRAGCTARRAARRRSRSRPRASPRRRRRSRGGGGAPRATTRSGRPPRAGSAPRPICRSRFSVSSSSASSFASSVVLGEQQRRAPPRDGRAGRTR